MQSNPHHHLLQYIEAHNSTYRGEQKPSESHVLGPFIGAPQLHL